MKKRTNTAQKFIAAIFTLFIAVPSVAIAVSTTEWPTTIIGFDRYNPVYSASVELETSLEDINLPDTVRGIVEIPSDLDIDSFTQNSSGGGGSK